MSAYNEFANYMGDRGVWMRYSHDQGPYIIAIYQDPVKMAEDHDHGDSVGFWPLNKTFREAVAWWENRTKNGASNES